MRLSRYSAWMGIGCGLVGLAISAFAKADDPSNTIGAIRLEESLPVDQAAILKHDREVFSTLTISESNTSLKSLLGTRSNSTDDLNAWLEARVQVIVGQSFDINKNLVVLASNYAYPNPGIYPSLEVPSVVSTTSRSDAGSDTKVDTNPAPAAILMSNFGVSTYWNGKARGNLMGLVIDGVGTLPVKSPRVGAIQIGAALFNPIYLVDRAHPKADANSIMRLGTFFHEAHHSDGNGKSLGFYHAICPPGHTYPGKGACDRDRNGSYTVGAQIMQALTESCTQCTKGQRESLRLQYIDSYNRVLPDELDGVTPIKNWNAAPEGIR